MTVLRLDGTRNYASGDHGHKYKNHEKRKAKRDSYIAFISRLKLSRSRFMKLSRCIAIFSHSSAMLLFPLLYTHQVVNCIANHIGRNVAHHRMACSNQVNYIARTQLNFLPSLFRAIAAQDRNSGDTQNSGKRLNEEDIFCGRQSPKDTCYRNTA